MQKQSSWLYFWLSITCVHNPCSMRCFCVCFLCFLTYFFICLIYLFYFLFFMCVCCLCVVLFVEKRALYTSLHGLVISTKWFHPDAGMHGWSFQHCSQCAIWSQVFGIKTDAVQVFSALSYKFDSAVPRKSVRHSWSFVMDQRLCYSSLCF